MSITFEPSISLGSIITGAMILITVIGAAMKFSSRLTALEIKMDLIWRHPERGSRHPEEYGG